MSAEIPPLVTASASPGQAGTGTTPTPKVADESAAAAAVQGPSPVQLAAPVTHKGFDLLNQFLSANGEQIEIKNDDERAKFLKLLGEENTSDLFKSELVTFASKGNWAEVRIKKIEWQFPFIKEDLLPESIEKIIARLARGSIKEGYNDVVKHKTDVARFAMAYVIDHNFFYDPKIDSIARFTKFLNNLRALTKRQVESSLAAAENPGEKKA